LRKKKGDDMKSKFLLTTSGLGSLTLLALSVASTALAQALNPPRYTVTDLGTLGGRYSYAYAINNWGVVAGGAATPTQTNGTSQTAFLWFGGHRIGLGTLGGADCPDCNSEAASAGAYGDVAILSETAVTDPNGEDFCGFGTHRQCLAATWKRGALRALPTLQGGDNSQAAWVNNRAQIIGYSENGTFDATCTTATPFQVTQFEAVIWDRNGEIRQLQPLKGDTVAFGFGINDEGQAIGSSGLCSNTALPPFVGGPQAAHAVLWDQDGSPHDLGGLVRGAAINLPGGINERGEVVGGAQSSNGAPHAFLWTQETGMQDLGALSGDFLSAAPCCHTINNKRQVVGFSIPGPLGSGRAFLWENGVMTDLNTLILSDSPWYLLEATSINDAGEIVGWGTINGNVHAFLATPVDFHRLDSEQ
jgi:probable HAF family extracellular repeat protein